MELLNLNYEIICRELEESHGRKLKKKIVTYKFLYKLYFIFFNFNVVFVLIRETIKTFSYFPYRCCTKYPKLADQIGHVPYTHTTPTPTPISC